MSKHVDMIKSLGFRVYMPTEERICRTWCYYTDGKHIAYAQWPLHDHPLVATVHAPNKTSGTGFVMGDITPENVTKALTTVTPHGASVRDAASVRKYASFEAFASKHWTPLAEV